MVAVVTGAAGFIGQALVRVLAERAEVLGVDRLPQPPTPGLTRITADLLDADPAHAHPPARRGSSVGTHNTASSTTAARSAARSVTAEASTGRTGSVVRRSTLVTRSASPRRSGSTWLPSRLTCSAAQDCPSRSPGNVRRQARARSANASA